MRILSAAALSACLSLAHTADAAQPSGTEPLELTRVLGGALQDPVIADPYVYVPSGRIVSVWDYSDPAAPTLVAAPATPVNGQIRGLTRWGDYLYASWSAGNDDAGVAVYSLADPAHPLLLNQFNDYVSSSLKILWTLAAANGYLYLFDRENGIYYGDLAPDPLHPTFTRLVRTPTMYDRSYVDGNWLYVSGTTSQANPNHVCGIYDVSVPGTPTATGTSCGSGDPLEFFRSRIQPPYAAAFGLKLSLFDVGDPYNTVTLGSVDTEPATDGFLSGDYAYSLGFAGIDIFDISDRNAPVAAGHSTIATLGTDSVTALEQGALLLTNTDRFTRLDVSVPTAPVLVSEATPPGGAIATDIALVDGKAVLLQENYGLGIADPVTLTPLARFDADLPEVLNQRDFEQFAVDGDRAYLTAWGYGLIVVDLSDPLHPAELGRLSYDYPSAAAASGDFVYIGTITNGGIVQVVDVSDPTQPTERGAITAASINRLQVHGDHVYAADELAGLHIIDVSNPDAPEEIALYDGGCMGVVGAAYDVALNADGTRAYVACETGLHIVDISDPPSPQTLGVYPATFANRSTVDARGDRAWFGDAFGVHEIDVADPAVPVEVSTTNLAYFAPFRLRALEDGRVFAFMTQAGVHVLGPPTADRIFADGFD
jgi:hypothetical protein